ncbi:MAG: sensor histidine kinase [Alphaproteobacteria bacterium]
MSDRRLTGGLGAVHRSFSARLALLVAIFLALPVIVYSEFRDADAEKIALLQKNTEAEGRLISMALLPILRTFDGSTADRVAEEARRFTQPGTVVRVLLRPRALGEDASLFIVAAAPPLPARRLDAERQRLLQAGVFRRIGPGCEPVTPEAQRYTNVSGAEEVLTSIVPFASESGCWVILVSKSTDDVLRSSLGRPYWKSAEVRIATAIYLLFACVVFWMFLDVWRNLRRFARLARDIRTGQSGELSFERHNRVPEISGVATEFDRLVLGLRASARSIREAAEENAHALKGPLAVISQSVEPLKRIAGTECEAGRALARIERSTERLDSLVSASRQLDNVTAELMEAPRERIDLSALVVSLSGSLESNHDVHDIRIVTETEDGLTAWGSDGLFETVIENVIENAIGYSPAGGEIHVTLRRVEGMAELSVIDEGPGVDAADLERIFERYFTDRPSSAMAAGAEDGPAHFGIGLWIARRNVEALGGMATAENVPDAGLKVMLRVPLAA